MNSKSWRRYLNAWVALVGGLVLGLQHGGALAKDQLREELHRTYPLAAAGRVELANVNGKIVIATWDRDEVKVDAVKQAKNQADLESVTIEIEAKPEAIRIKSKYPDSKRSNSSSVDYTVTVPRAAQLDKISNVNGAVEIDGVRGAVHASTVNGVLKATGLTQNAELSSVNGAVQASFDRVDAVKTISLKTVNGKTTLALPEGADADVTAHTVNGRISTEQPLTVKKRWPLGSDLSGTLGKGGTHIELSTVNGAIAIERRTAR